MECSGSGVAVKYHIAMASVAQEGLSLLLNQGMRAVLERHIAALAENPEQQGLPLVVQRECSGPRQERGARLLSLNLTLTLTLTLTEP